MARIWPLDPETYPRHALHHDERIWPESNCYVDLWIELLHTMRLEPLAACPFVFGVDLEGDQWTFFKVSLEDLQVLYGVEVIELNVWRPLIDHVEGQLGLGRPSIVEVDAYYLPDTIGTSYHTEHVKTSIAVQEVDRSARRLGYFHNLGYYELGPTDFCGVFQLESSATADPRLPPYVEVVKIGARRPLTGQALVRASLERFGGHLARRPAANPFHRYAKQLQTDLELVAGGSLEAFHRYAFATFRQFGAAFELGSSYLRWLGRNGEHGLEPIAGGCELLAESAKALQFAAARTVNARRPFDPRAMLDTMTVAWDETMTALDERYGALTYQE